MVAKSRTPIEAKDLKGLKYFKLLASLLNRLLDDATARDRAGNRRLFYDQYACLLLLSFFKPIVKSLRGIQQASELESAVPARRDSLSEASRVFDPELLHEIIGQVAAQAIPLVDGREAEALRGLTVPARRESLLPAVPKMSWALGLSRRAGTQHRAAKMHVNSTCSRALRSKPL